MSWKISAFWILTEIEYYVSLLEVVQCTNSRQGMFAYFRLLKEATVVTYTSGDATYGTRPRLLYKVWSLE